MLNSMQVVSQLDRKFILTSIQSQTSSLLFAIDQHAADERIQLEKLEEAALENGEPKEHGLIEIAPIAEPFSVTNPKHIQTAIKYEKWLNTWKWQFNYSSVPSASSSVGSFNIVKAPLILVTVPQLLEICATGQDFIAHLDELEKYVVVQVTFFFTSFFC